MRDAPFAIASSTCSASSSRPATDDIGPRRVCSSVGHPFASGRPWSKPSRNSSHTDPSTMSRLDDVQGLARVTEPAGHGGADGPVQAARHSVFLCDASVLPGGLKQSGRPLRVGHPDRQWGNPGDEAGVSGRRLGVQDCGTPLGHPGRTGRCVSYPASCSIRHAAARSGTPL